jgi:hypothetical protein
VAHPVLGRPCIGRSGSVARIKGDDLKRVVPGLPSIAGPTGEAFGPHDVWVAGDGEVYVTIGLVGRLALRARFCSKGTRPGHLLEADFGGSKDSVADLAGFEAEANPDEGLVDSNPFGILRVGNKTLVTDAGANALNAVDSSGDVGTAAVFPNRLVTFQWQKVPMQAVPNTVVKGPDGAYYVGQLTGFPFPVGGARVYRVVPGEKPQIHARGLTNIIDISFGPYGSLYVLEIAHNSLRADAPEGALIRVAPGGERSIVTDGLFFPIGLAIGDGSF